MNGSLPPPSKSPCPVCRHFQCLPFHFSLLSSSLDSFPHPLEFAQLSLCHSPGLSLSCWDTPLTWSFCRKVGATSARGLPRWRAAGKRWSPQHSGALNTSRAEWEPPANPLGTVTPGSPGAGSAWAEGVCRMWLSPPTTPC